MNQTALEKDSTKCNCKSETRERKYSKELTEFLYSEYEAQGVRLGS